MDRHAKEKGGPTFSDTLQGMLRFPRRDAGINTVHAVHNDADSEDLCQRLLSSSLSSTEALSRPSLDRSTAAITLKNAAPDRLGLSKSNRHKPTPSPEDELVGRVIRAYRVFAHVGLFSDSTPGTPSSNRGTSPRDHLFVIYFTFAWQDVLCFVKLDLESCACPDASSIGRTELLLAPGVSPAAGVGTTESSSGTSLGETAHVCFSWGGLVLAS